MILVDRGNPYTTRIENMPKAYPSQFKQQCVDTRLVLGKTRAEVAREYEVSASALGRWVAAAQGTGSGSHRCKADPDS